MKAVIVGCGQIAGGYDRISQNHKILTHAKAYQKADGIELVGAFDPDHEKCAAFSRDWDLGKPKASLAATLAEYCPDVVSVCSPTNTHHAVVMEVAKFGVRGIICEKPLAYSFVEAREILERCQQDNITLLVNYHRRWDLELTLLAKRIRGGEFGQPLHGRVVYTKGLIHNGSHFVNFLVSIFGEITEKVPFSKSSLGAEDIALSFEVRFKNGFKVIFQACHPSPYQFNEIDLFFERKRIEITQAGAQIIETDVTEFGDLRVLNPLKNAREGTIGVAMLAVVQNMVNSLTSDCPLNMAPDEALTTLNTCIELQKMVTGSNFE